MSPMMVWLSGIRVPVPRPWIARAKIRKPKLWLIPARTVPSMKTTRPAR